MAISIFDIFIEKFAIGSGLRNIFQTSWYGPRKLLGVLKICGANGRFFWRN